MLRGHSSCLAVRLGKRAHRVEEMAKVKWRRGRRRWRRGHECGIRVVEEREGRARGRGMGERGGGCRGGIGWR